VSYRLKLTKPAQDAYVALQDADLKKINRALERIKNEPHYVPGHITPLKGKLKGQHRYKERSGWRVIYLISDEEQTVTVMTISRKSKNTYKR